MIKVYSKLFMEEEDETWSARPSRELMERMHRNEDSMRWIAVLGNIHIALGDPIGDGVALYVPQWIMDSAGMESGEEYDIQFVRCEEMPKAVRIGLKIIGNIPDDIDIKELLEEPLSQLGVIEEGQIIPAPVLEGVHLLVQICEPAGAVFLDGEASLEIETDAPVPLAPPAPAPAPEDFESLPDISMPNPTGWRPFQGIGRRLCD